MRALGKGPVAVLAWALLLAALATMLWIWTSDTIPIALLGGAAVAAALVAVAVASSTGVGRRAVPELSIPTGVVAAGVVAAVAGAAAGQWLVWVGGGMVVVGLAGIFREGLWSSRR